MISRWEWIWQLASLWLSCTCATGGLVGVLLLIGSLARGSR